jgi:hypothetical protein
VPVGPAATCCRSAHWFPSGTRGTGSGHAGRHIAQFATPVPDVPPIGPTAAPKRSVLIWALATLWIVCVVAGLSVLWAYENTPGRAGNIPLQWPIESQLSRASDGPTLILFAHPQCTCTRASLGEFAETLARATTRPRAYVVFLKPIGFGLDWEKTDLWRTASRIPGVRVIRDDKGLEATRFRVVTSGQTALYDESGALLFSGGITGARGHAGDNAGRASIVTLLNKGKTDVSWTSVFGCSLFAFAN